MKVLARCVEVYLHVRLTMLSLTDAVITTTRIED
jgi:hypothetical protein